MVDFPAYYVRAPEGSNCKNVVEYLPCFHTIDWDTSHVDPYGEAILSPWQAPVDARNIGKNNKTSSGEYHMNKISRHNYNMFKPLHTIFENNTSQAFSVSQIF